MGGQVQIIVREKISHYLSLKYFIVELLTVVGKFWCQSTVLYTIYKAQQSQMHKEIDISDRNKSPILWTATNGS